MSVGLSAVHVGGQPEELHVGVGVWFSALIRQADFGERLVAVVLLHSLVNAQVTDCHLVERGSLLR